MDKKTYRLFTGIAPFCDNIEKIIKVQIQKAAVSVKPLSHLMAGAAHDDPAHTWCGPAGHLPRCHAPALSRLLHASHRAVIWLRICHRNGLHERLVALFTEPWKNVLSSLMYEKYWRYSTEGRLVTAVRASVSFGGVRRCIKGSKRLSFVVTLFRKVGVREYLK